ncbi:MAG: hypothetical protein ABJG15_10470 [Hyphomonadaceae bacterium]
MIETQGDTTTIRPTPWKWYTGAAIAILLGLSSAGGVGMGTSVLLLAVALFSAGMGSGKLQNVELSARGIKSRNMWKTRSYAWSDIEDFKIVSIRTSLFSSSKMLAFSRKDKKESFTGKASRFLAGGTESLPISGISPQELMASIGGYQARAYMSDQIGQTGSDFAPASTQPSAPRPAASDGPIGFGRSEAPAKSAPVRAPRPAAKPAPVTFGRQSPSTPKAKPAQRKAPTSDPLVKEGGLFRKRRDVSGF